MPLRSYRDSIDVNKQQYRSDTAILESVDYYNQATPRLLAEDRFRENVLRLQCRDLCQVGLLSACSHDTFRVTKEGQAFLDDTSLYPNSTGLLEIDRIEEIERPHSDWRITDFSILDAETIKTINLDLFTESIDDQYGWIQADPELTERRIKNVKDSQVDRVMREFPTNEPLPQQCAHWMRAFAGLHFFPDGNHRTGMNTLQILVEENPCEISLPISKDIERFVLQSKLTRHLNSKIQLNTLWKRDAHYAIWHQYFRNLLCDVPDRHPCNPSDNQLRQTLQYARALKEGTTDDTETRD